MQVQVSDLFRERSALSAELEKVKISLQQVRQDTTVVPRAATRHDCTDTDILEGGFQKLTARRKKAENPTFGLSYTPSGQVKLGGEKNKKNNKHKQLLGIVPGTDGGSNLFMC